MGNEWTSDVLFEGTKVSGSEDTDLVEASCIMREPIISSTQECSRGHPGEQSPKNIHRSFSLLFQEQNVGSRNSLQEGGRSKVLWNNEK